MIKEITLPAGTFRMLKPNVWTQVSGTPIIELIQEAHKVRAKK